MSNSANIVRIACDLALPNRAPVNIIDGMGLFINRGKAYSIELGIFDKGVWQESIGQFASVTMQVRPTRVGAAIIDKTVLIVSTAVAESSWNDRTAQHAVITLTGAQTNALTVPAPYTLGVWVSIFATTTGGEIVTLASGDMTAVEDGSNFTAATPIAGDPTYLTAAQTIAAIESAVGSGREIRAGLWIVIPTVDSDGMVSWAARLA
jgi:hypothetical protein